LRATFVLAKNLHLAIDAINIRQGGGVTHLIQILEAAEPSKYGFSKVTIFTSVATAELLPSYPWLIKYVEPWMNYGLLFRSLFLQWKIPLYLKSLKCDALFSPGGTIPVFANVVTVTMSQNMLPFDLVAANTFGRFSLMRFKLFLLKYVQSAAFKRADGIIFLTKYARNQIEKELDHLKGLKDIIPHGIEDRFFCQPRVQYPVESYSFAKPFQLLYVSIFMPYKHQVELAWAIAQLRKDGAPIEIQFIGPSWGWYSKEFNILLKELDPKSNFLKSTGSMSFKHLHEFYKSSDAFVFASSCENLPNILIEAMAAGLPIVSSNLGPMPEILGDSGIYFDPRNVSSIVEGVRNLVNDDALRHSLAMAGFARSRAYSWKESAARTFSFIEQVINKSKD
jgi:glycosyltransferase involved in cell wall biosynthesis